MRHRTIPGTDVTVSEVGFGVHTVAAGWRGARDERDAVDLLRAAFERGITLYDLSGVAGDGRGEALLATAFSGRRDQVVYAADLPHDGTPASLRSACELTLRRLDTDRLDICRLHDARMSAARAGELLAALDDLVAEGRVRSVGVTLGSGAGSAGAGLAARGARTVTSLAVSHDLLDQDPGRELLAGAHEAGLGVVVREPHAAGLLEGKYTVETTFPSHDHRGRRPRSWLLDGLRKVEALRFLTHDRPHTLGQAALKWALAQPAVVSTLPDIYGMRQLAEFAAAPDLPDLADEDLARVRELHAEGFGVRPEAPATA